MVDILYTFYFVVAIVIVLVVAQLTKNKSDTSLSKRSYTPDDTIIDVESTPINDNISPKPELFSGVNIPTITDGNLSTKNHTVFQNVINFLNSDEVYFRYGKNKVEKDYQQDLEQKLALMKERFGYKVHYEAKEGKHRIDFLINGNVGIEMKVHKGGTQVEKELFYQITRYGKLYPKIIGLVLNDSDIENQQLKSEIVARLRDQNVLDRKDYEYLMDIVDVVRGALMKVVHVGKVYLLYMDEAKHVHWHLVPRYNEEGFNVFAHEPKETRDFSLVLDIQNELKGCI